MAQKITSIILPALNEADGIGHVLSSIPQEWVQEILVVDGGSTDGTIQIAGDYGARVIHESRRGTVGPAIAGCWLHRGNLLSSWMPMAPMTPATCRSCSPRC